MTEATIALPHVPPAEHGGRQVDHADGVASAASAPKTPAYKYEPVHWVLDIETLGIEPGSVVTDIAVVQVGGKITEQEAVWLDIEEQLARGASVDASTLGFRFKHGVAKSQHDPVRVRDAYDWLVNTVDENDIIWCRGYDFDMGHIEHLRRTYCPQDRKLVPYYNVRCIRTANDVVNLRFDKKHDALEDAMQDAAIVAEFLALKAKR